MKSFTGIFNVFPIGYLLNTQLHLCLDLFTMQIIVVALRIHYSHAITHARCGTGSPL